MRRYENMGTAIEIHIKDEYYVVAFINLVDYEQGKYDCELYIKDTESGLLTSTGKFITLTSEHKKIKFDITYKLSNMIDDGYFDEYIKILDDIYTTLSKVHNF